MSKIRTYKTWVYTDSATGETSLRTWDDYVYNQSVFYSDKSASKLKLVGALQGNQKPFRLDDKGIYRELRNKKVYYVTIEGAK